jgi:NADPH:quinone reductase-like Zn-dependent oxidoreductase
VVLNLATAVACLNVSMGLDRPPVEGKAKPNGKKVLIYGGSSSLGGLATRYISDAGYEVVTTSSPKNESFVSSLGARVVVDHTQNPDAVATELKSHGPYDGILDCIGTPPVDMLMAKVLGETGGTYETMVPAMGGFKMPENVKRQTNSYSMFLETTHKDLGEFYYKQYLPKALADGRIVPTRIEKISGGLGGVQKAMDLSLTVSGRKLIVDPWE